MLSNSTIGLTIWMPTVQGPYVWMPWALVFCERLLRAARLHDAMWLGIVFALALLPGHPQFALLGGELVGMRLLWGLTAAAERRRLLPAAGGVALAIAVMLLLTAVQLLPALEVAAESVRGHLLDGQETRGALTWEHLTRDVLLNTTLAPFGMMPGLVAAAAFAHRSRRRPALFFALAGGVFLLLAFGTATPVGQLYLMTPLGRAFRMPMRFMYGTGFCVSMLIGIAIDALLEGSWVAVSAVGAALVGCRLWSGGLSATHWVLAASVIAGGALAATFPRRRAAGLLAVGAVVLAALLLPVFSMQRYLPADDPLWTHAEVFDGLRARLSPQDRTHFARPALDLGFQEKTPILFALRAITDYEGQTARTYDEFLTMMRTGQPLLRPEQAIYPGLWNPMAVRWPLLNLAAARYLAVAPELDGPVKPRHVFLVPFDGDPGVHTYENLAALPRAYYVPRVAVVTDPDARLTRLAAGAQDPREVALVEALPPSGFGGAPGNDARAPARFVTDDPEHVVLELDAPEHGFLFLADQYFPGWSATVNGQPQPILRANHTFRLVEIPKGRVRVEFRYRPMSVWLGAIISLVTLLIVALVLARTRPDRLVAEDP
jgi:hypothetical protein